MTQPEIHDQIFEGHAHQILIEARRAFIRIRKRALIDAANDVCWLCAKCELLSEQYEGVYVHGSHHCPASAIWARIKYEYGET